MFALTGKLGITWSSYLEEAFTLDDENHELATIYYILYTKAGQCGVFNKQCNKCWRHGQLISKTMMAKEMGRTNYMQVTILGEHGYFIYLNITTFLLLWMRT